MQIHRPQGPKTIEPGLKPEIKPVGKIYKTTQTSSSKEIILLYTYLFLWIVLVLLVLYILPTGFISGFNPGSMVLGVLGVVALSAPMAPPFPENVGGISSHPTMLVPP